jgi:MerR family transcriptional regulator, copper efflux regulator
MRITEAAQALGTSARMLRYREALGLLPAAAGRRAGRDGQRPAGAGHRQFGDGDLAAAALGLSIERRYDISPAALAFGVRVLADPKVRAEVADLGRRIGRIQAPPARALDFEQERALRLLRLGAGAPPVGDNRPGASGRRR